MNDLPETAIHTETGWKIDLGGLADPKPALPVAAIVLAVVALGIAALSTWWLLPPFLAFAVAMLNPRGGTPVHGFELDHNELEVYGLPRVPIHLVGEPERTAEGMQIELDGVPHRLVLAGDDDEIAWLVDRINAERLRHGSTNDVPDQLEELRTGA